MVVAIGGRDDDEVLEAEQELAFSDANDRLPWLESDDEDDERGVDTGRIFAFAVVGLMALVLLVSALWWFTRDREEVDTVAEGGTIEAPEGPYKVKPADAGGRQVAGTGDTSFQVAEGRTVEGRVAETAAPTPTPTVTPRQPAAPKPTASATKAPAPASGVGVQVGAYSTRASAEAGWTQLSGRLSPLQGRSHRIVEGTVDGSIIYRLQAVAGSAAEADSLCRNIKAAGGDCQVKR